MTDVVAGAARGFSSPMASRGPLSAARGASNPLGGPGFAERFSNVLFGAPSVRAAFGLCDASRFSERVRSSRVFPERPSRSASSRLRANRVPVYALDAPTVPRAGALPRIWVSEPVRDEKTGEVVAREFSASYPNGGDEGGERAFRLACSCLGEGFSYFRATDDRVRVECFKAAELLLLHAVKRGSLSAYVALGSLYASDLCEGSYFGVPSDDAGDLPRRLGARALECFSHAAARGDAEACLKLGEMTAAGRACVRDEQRALDLFVRAFGLADAAGDASVGGNAALLIAQAYERGSGCEQSFRRAYSWYRIAADELAYVVDEGAWRCKKPRARAMMGVRRMRQELVGGC